MRLRILATSLLPLTVMTALLLPATPAAAHDALASATPGAGASVSGHLNQATLTFSDAPLAGLETGLVISVTGPDGAEASVGSVRVDGSTLTKPVDLSIPGGYTLAWRSVPVDGHPVSGSYQFTSTGIPTATATAPAAPAHTTTGTLTATPTATPTATAAAPTDPAAIWTLGGLTAALILAVVAVLVLTRRRAKAPE